MGTPYILGFVLPHGLEKDLVAPPHFLKGNGKQLINLMSSHFAMMLVILSLLLGAKVTYFSPSDITTAM
jgi:hypothetical protein